MESPDQIYEIEFITFQTAIPLDFLIKSILVIYYMIIYTVVSIRLLNLVVIRLWYFSPATITHGLLKTIYKFTKITINYIYNWIFNDYILLVIFKYWYIMWILIIWTYAISSLFLYYKCSIKITDFIKLSFDMCYNIILNYFHGFICIS